MCSMCYWCRSYNLKKKIIWNNVENLLKSILLCLLKIFVIVWFFLNVWLVKMLCNKYDKNEIILKLKVEKLYYFKIKGIIIGMCYV